MEFVVYNNTVRFGVYPVNPSVFSGVTSHRSSGYMLSDSCEVAASHLT